MGYLAAIAVDRRQNYILSADKLQEMLGASRLIAATVEIAKDIAKAHEVEIVRPVSGELWVWSESLVQLRRYLWEVRRKVVDNYQLSASFAVIDEEEDGAAGSFQKAAILLEGRLQEIKQNREGADGTPASPYFARCKIQPNLAANVWYPELPAGQPDEFRRRLVSHSSSLRLKSSDDYWNDLTRRIPELRNFRKPTQVRHLAEGGGDSYTAFLKADVDNLGDIQMNADWDYENSPKARRKMVYAFSEKLGEAVGGAVSTAIREGLAQCEEGGYAPVLPLVIAGDDLWILCRRKLALRFAATCARVFSDVCKQHDVLQIVADGRPLTITFGVLFAKQGYPMDQQLSVADDLLRNAKRFRREKGIVEGCIDYFWLASAGREDIEEARSSGAAYATQEGDGLAEYRLFTRPWTISQAESMLNAASKLDHLPTGKLHQMQSILRFGGDLTRLALHQWWIHLRSDHRKCMEDALREMPPGLALRKTQFCGRNGALPEAHWLDGNRSPLLELFELAEIVAAKRREAVE